MKRTILAAAAACLALPFIIAAAPAAGPRATVAQGMLNGTIDDGVSVFRGVPYAAAPVGALRWAPPQPAVKWTGTKDATKWGASCPQTLAPQGRAQWTTEYMAPGEPGTSEDCLFVNIWTSKPMTGAKPAADQPVLLFIHGGGYTEGAGSVAVYNGASLAKKGVVVVNMNYRLGGLGYFAHPELSAANGGSSGNQGVQDAIAALQWIRDNIASFGGDPTKVTIAGQSAGAGEVLALLVSPQAKGLFRGAIVQSAPGVGTNGNYGPLAASEQQGVAAFGRLGAANLAAARALPLDKIMGGGLRGGPIGDGKVIPPGTPPLASNVPVVIGYTADDLFGNRIGPVTAAAWKAEAADRYGDKAADFLKYYPGDTDAQATQSARKETYDRTYALKLVDWLGVRGATAPVYGYIFSHVEPGPQSGQYGAFHTSEVPYEFDALRLSPNRTFTDVDRKLADQFSSYVANFAKTGSPNGAGLPQWQAMTAQNKAIMNLGDTVTPSRAVPEGADAVIAAGRAPGRGGGAPAGGGRGGAPGGAGRGGAPAAPAGRGG